MGLSELFLDHEPKMRDLLTRLAAEYGLIDDRESTLELVDTDNRMLFRSIPSKRLVKVEWRGIASLWAASQAMGRLAPAIFAARRKGASGLATPDQSQEQLGLQLIAYGKELCVRQKWRWNTYFPKPDLNTASKPAQIGEVFFMWALEWILRHELAHIALGHLDSPWSDDESRAQEREADRHASQALRSGMVIDSGRALGAQPSETELNLERRALAAGIGLIWVALYEGIGEGPGAKYPPVASRLCDSFTIFSLAEDSAAAEILSDFIKAWVDPDGKWPPLAPEMATAQAALSEACSRLDAYLKAQQAQS